MLLPVTRCQLPKTQRLGSGVSQSVNNAHFNFSPVRCHRTEHGRVGPELERGYVPIKSLANKVGVTKLQHIAAGTAQSCRPGGKLTAEPKIGGNGAKTEPNRKCSLGI